MGKIMLNGVDYSAPTSGGSEALSARLDSNRVYIGLQANASGNNGISIGAYSRALNTNSIALGCDAHAREYTSMALGYNAFANGYGSISIGRNAGTHQMGSIAIGYDARVCSGDNWWDSIALGPHANVNGNCSTALGYNANTISDYSIALGTNAETFAITSIALGYDSCVHTNSSQSAALGPFAEVSGTRSVALGFSATTANSNSIQLGSSTYLSSITAKVAITVTSDERDKTDINTIEDGAIDFLKNIRPIRYLFNGRELYIDEENLSDEERRKKEKYGLCAYDREQHALGTKKGNRIRVGVLAQNVQEMLKKVYGDSGYANLVNDNLFDLDPNDIPEGVENQLAVNYEGFIPFLIKAVQELDAKLEMLTREKGKEPS